jgi:hypothetical protein
MLQPFGYQDLDVPNSGTPMNMQPHFETTREVAAISKILADLVRTVQLIESDIVTSAVTEREAPTSGRTSTGTPGNRSAGGMGIGGVMVPPFVLLLRTDGVRI